MITKKVVLQTIFCGLIMLCTNITVCMYNSHWMTANWHKEPKHMATMNRIFYIICTRFCFKALLELYVKPWPYTSLACEATTHHCAPNWRNGLLRMRRMGIYAAALHLWWSLFLKVLLASVVIQQRVLQKMMEEMKAGSCQCPGATFLCTEKTCGGNLWKRKIPRSATVTPS